MRKQFLLLMALCLAVGQSWAERIDVATAREVARTVASRGSTLRSAGELSLVYAAAPGQTGSALRSASAAGEADYFVFNVPGDGGFVIVAGATPTRAASIPTTCRRTCVGCSLTIKNKSPGRKITPWRPLPPSPPSGANTRAARH